MEMALMQNICVVLWLKAAMIYALGESDPQHQHVPTYSILNSPYTHISPLAMNSHPAYHLQNTIYRTNVKDKRLSIPLYKPNRPQLYTRNTILPLPPGKPKPITDVYKPQPSYDPKPIYHPPPKQSYEPVMLKYKSHPIIRQESIYRPPSYQSNLLTPKVSYKPSSVKSHNEIHSHLQPTYEPQQKASIPAYEILRPYSFDYGVKDDYTGTNFGHSERSDGNKVEGSYTVALPDGRIQKVTYVADKYSGFQAKVTYEGEAKYPAFVPKKTFYTFHQPQRRYHRPLAIYRMRENEPPPPTITHLVPPYNPYSTPPFLF